MRKIVIIIISLIMFLNTSCGVNQNKTIKYSESEKSSFDYSELSDISSLAENKTWNYNEHYTSCQTYEWGDNVNMPLPLPQNGTFVDTINDVITVDNVDLDSWIMYVEYIKMNYIVLWEEFLLEDTPFRITFCDNTNNLIITIIWREKDEDKNLDNHLTMNIYLGCQENLCLLSNNQILDKALEKLKIDKEDFGICNISSQNNIREGFFVYYICPPQEFCQKEQVNSYICVVRDENIVFLEANQVLYLSTDEIEFKNINDSCKMYILSSKMSKEYMGGAGIETQQIDEYILQNNMFVCKKSYSVGEIANVNDSERVTFERNNDSIEIYKLIRNDILNNDSIPGYMEWTIGEKLGVLE